MEGSRHERAAVLVAAYIIGFTTAYIAFGIGQLGNNLTTLPVMNSASVISAPALQTGITAASVTPTGLQATINGKTITVSATMPNPTTGILPDGYNVAVADYSISPDGRYLYYCEQPSLSVDSCRPFVYSVADAGSHPVTQADQRVAFGLDAPRATWDAGDVLNANGVPSVGKPWQF